MNLNDAFCDIGFGNGLTFDPTSDVKVLAKLTA
jgi:hypothetical protein